MDKFYSEELKAMFNENGSFKLKPAPKKEQEMREIIGKYLNKTLRCFHYGIGSALMHEYTEVDSQQDDIERNFQEMTRELINLLENLEKGA